MRTDTDLLEVFTQIANETSDVDVPIAGRPRRSRLRFVVVAATLAAIVAGGGVALGVAHSRSATVGSPSPSPAEWAYDINLDLPSGWNWDQRRLGGGGWMMAEVTRQAAGSDVNYCTLTVAYGGQTDDLFYTTPTRVGTFPATVGSSRSDADVADPARRRLVSWSPAPGRSAETVCAKDDHDATAARMLGTALRLGPDSFLSPFTYTTLPFGLDVSDITLQTPGASSMPRVDGSLQSGLGPSSQSTAPALPSRQAAVTFEVENVSELRTPYTSGTRRTDVDGRQIWVRTVDASTEFRKKLPATSPMVAHLYVVDGSRVLTLTSTDLDVDQLAQAAEALSLAPDLGDMSTWFQTSTFGRTR